MNKWKSGLVGSGRVTVADFFSGKRVDFVREDDTKGHSSR